MRNYCQHADYYLYETKIFLPKDRKLAEAFIMAYTKADLGDSLPLLASGKVRELYVVAPRTLLFVASDRISAYDVIMKNVQ